MPTIQELQEQLNQLQAQINALTGVPLIEFKTIIAEPNYVFRRNHDGMIFGNEILLGYDYSLGIKRIDSESFYTQVLDPDISQNSQEGE